MLEEGKNRVLKTFYPFFPIKLEKYVGRVKQMNKKKITAMQTFPPSFGKKNSVGEKMNSFYEVYIHP